MIYIVSVCSVASVMSDSLRPHGPLPAWLLSLWDSPGKDTGVGCHFLLQRYMKCNIYYIFRFIPRYFIFLWCYESCLYFLKHFASSFLYWSKIDLQYYVSFRCTEKLFIYIFLFRFFSLIWLQNIEYNSLCYTIDLLLVIYFTYNSIDIIC